MSICLQKMTNNCFTDWAVTTWQQMRFPKSKAMADRGYLTDNWLFRTPRISLSSKWTVCERQVKPVGPRTLFRGVRRTRTQRCTDNTRPNAEVLERACPPTFSSPPAGPPLGRWEKYRRQTHKKRQGKEGLALPTARPDWSNLAGGIWRRWLWLATALRPTRGGLFSWFHRCVLFIGFC